MGRAFRKTDGGTAAADDDPHVLRRACGAAGGARRLRPLLVVGGAAHARAGDPADARRKARQRRRPRRPPERRADLRRTGGGPRLVRLAESALARVLFGVSPSDPMSTVAASAVLVVAALIACIPPALRAMRVDPWWGCARNSSALATTQSKALRTDVGGSHHRDSWRLALAATREYDGRPVPARAQEAVAHRPRYEAQFLHAARTQPHAGDTSPISRDARIVRPRGSGRRGREPRTCGFLATSGRAGRRRATVSVRRRRDAFAIPARR